MTGIDNTVLAEALRLLSPYRDQGRVWDTLEELIAAPPAQREAILRQPRQQEPSTSEFTKGRFFNGHNKKSTDQGSTNFAWWPEDDRRYPGQQFEKMLTAQFPVVCHPHPVPAQGDRGNCSNLDRARSGGCLGRGGKRLPEVPRPPPDGVRPPRQRRPPGMGGRDDPSGQAGQRQPRRGPKTWPNSRAASRGRPLPLGQRHRQPPGARTIPLQGPGPVAALLEGR